MMITLVHLGLFLASFVILWQAANYFVDSSHALALHLKLPPFIIGATVVAFGTSAPELFVSGFASWYQQSDIVYGNIIGSNMANICLIFGVSLLMAPIKTTRTLTQQLMINGFITIVFMGIVGLWGASRWAGFFGIVFFLWYQWRTLKQSNNDNDETHHRSLAWAMSVFGVSLLGLVGSSRLLVAEVLALANILGISTIFLSSFLVALGTSLPELITTVRFIGRGHTDIVIGNVFGSNLFNLGFVMPLVWIIKPLPFIPVFYGELITLILVSVIGLIMSRFNPTIYRKTGLTLLIIYMGYIGALAIR